MKKQNKDIKKWVDDISNDENQRLWEEGQLGKEMKYSKVSYDLSFREKPMPTSIRLPKNLIEELRKMASEEGLPYQTYLKMVLIKHVKNNVA